MFYSTQHLIGRDAQFNVIWMAAMHSKLKKVTRKKILEIDVAQICESIEQHIPSGKHNKAELTRKFSLYLMAHLLYGTCIVYDKQLTYLEADARELSLAVKPILYLMSQDVKKTKKERRRKSRDAQADELDMNLAPNARDLLLTSPLRLDQHIDSVDGLDRVIGMAPYHSITLADPEPMIWRGPDLFQDDLMPLTDADKQMFGDWNEQRTSSSKESITKSTMSLEGRDPIYRHQKEMEELDLEFPPLDRTSGLPGLDMMPPDAFPDQFPLPPRDDAEMLDLDAVLAREAGDQPMEIDGQPPIGPAGDDGSKRQPAGSDGSQQVTPIQGAQALTREVSFELIPIVKPGSGDAAVTEEARDTPRVKRVRRSIMKDDEAHQIPVSAMKAMMSDFTSLLRAKDSLQIDMEQLKWSKFDKLEKAYPTWYFPGLPHSQAAELRDMYRSCAVQPFTFEEVMEHGLDHVFDRGDQANVWHYEDSQDERQRTPTKLQSEGSDGEPRRMFGVAHLFGSPEREMEHVGIAGSRISLSPKRPRLDELIADGDLPLTMAATPLHDPFAPLDQEALFPPGADLNFPPIDQELERDGRQSRISSHLEASRRDTIGTNFPGDGRPSHIDESQSQENLELMGRGDVNEAGYRCKDYKPTIHRCVAEMGSFMFSEIVPVATTNRSNAAHAFSQLLEMAKKQLVTLEQTVPFSDIGVEAGPKFVATNMQLAYATSTTLSS